MNPEDLSNPATKGELRNLQEQNDKSNKLMLLLMTGVIVVMFVGFITLIMTAYGFVIDAHRFKDASYEDLKDQVLHQNETLSSFTECKIK